MLGMRKRGDEARDCEMAEANTRLLEADGLCELGTDL